MSLDFKSLFQNDWVNSVGRYNILEGEESLELKKASTTIHFKDLDKPTEHQKHNTVSISKIRNSILKKPPKEEEPIFPDTIRSKKNILDLVMEKVSLSNSVSKKRLCTSIKKRRKKSTTMILKNSEDEQNEPNIFKFSLERLSKKVERRDSKNTINQMNINQNNSYDTRVTHSTKIVKADYSFNFDHSTDEQVEEFASDPDENLNFVSFRIQRTTNKIGNYKIDLNFLKNQNSSSIIIIKDNSPVRDKRHGRHTSYPKQIELPKVCKSLKEVSSTKPNNILFINNVERSELSNIESTSILETSIFKSLNLESLTTLENAISLEHPKKEEAKSLMQSFFDYINPFRCVINNKFIP